MTQFEFKPGNDGKHPISYALPLKPIPLKNKMKPYYSALLTQLMIQIFIILQISIVLNPVSFKSPLYSIIYIGGTISVGGGAIMILITFFTSIEFYNTYKDFKYIICLFSAVIGFVIGCYILYLRAVM